MNDPKSMAFQFISQVSEEFVLHKTAIHRRPVHRSPLGDVQLNISCLTAFLYAYFINDGLSDDDLAMKFFKMLDIYNLKGQGCIASIGNHEGLKPEAISEIEGVIDFFAEAYLAGVYQNEH